ncbi:rod-binding protein [Pseudodonghicola sp.]|uniref:rod-binding protein n=1 Tax=Pseudodonghicola sp. TaxID=1969463 RepID=UPI003A9812E4
MTDLTSVSAAAMQATVAGEPQPTAEDMQVAQKFEAVFISQFVDQMMSTVDYGPASGGQGAEMWRSFLSDAMAQQLADRGGLGMGESIGRMLAAYRR